MAKGTGQLCTAGEERCWPFMVSEVRSGDASQTAYFLLSCLCYPQQPFGVSAEPLGAFLASLESHQTEERLWLRRKKHRAFDLSFPKKVGGHCQDEGKAFCPMGISQVFIQPALC